MKWPGGCSRNAGAYSKPGGVIGGARGRLSVAHPQASAADNAAVIPREAAEKVLDT
jgi:hypothetical protein